jgi:hypothetical protein
MYKKAKPPKNTWNINQNEDDPKKKSRLGTLKAKRSQTLATRPNLFPESKNQ